MIPQKHWLAARGLIGVSHQHCSRECWSWQHGEKGDRMGLVTAKRANGGDGIVEGQATRINQILFLLITARKKTALWPICFFSPPNDCWPALSSLLPHLRAHCPAESPKHSHPEKGENEGAEGVLSVGLSVQISVHSRWSAPPPPPPPAPASSPVEGVAHQPPARRFTNACTPLVVSDKFF